MRPGVRIDAGITAGQEISPFYDPMIAKIITYGETREVARKLMVDVLRETALFGVRTNRDFLIACLENDQFSDGEFSTAFIAEEFGEDGFSDALPSAAELAVLGVRHYLLDRDKASAKSLNMPEELLVLPQMSIYIRHIFWRVRTQPTGLWFGRTKMAASWSM